MSYKCNRANHRNQKRCWPLAAKKYFTILSNYKHRNIRRDPDINLITLLVFPIRTKPVEIELRCSSAKISKVLGEKQQVWLFRTLQ